MMMAANFELPQMVNWTGLDWSGGRPCPRWSLAATFFIRVFRQFGLGTGRRWRTAGLASQAVQRPQFLTLTLTCWPAAHSAFNDRQSPNPACLDGVKNPAENSRRFQFSIFWIGCSGLESSLSRCKSSVSRMGRFRHLNPGTLPMCCHSVLLCSACQCRRYPRADKEMNMRRMCIAQYLLRTRRTPMLALRNAMLRT